jgi:hypothetical protein
MPEAVGWPALVFIASGLLAGLLVLRDARRNHGAHPVASVGRGEDGSGGRSAAARVVLAFSICSWLFFTVVSNKDVRFNLPSLPFLLMLATLNLYRLAPSATRMTSVGLSAWLVVALVVGPPVPVVSGYLVAAQVVQQHAPVNRNVLIAAHRDGSFIYNMRTLGKRFDIGIRRADKMLVEINIDRVFGIKDRMLDQAAIRALLEAQQVSMVVLQSGYLLDLSTMRNLSLLLNDKKYYRRLLVVPMHGATSPSERELVIYEKNDGDGSVAD